jgi:hypothetical protein
MNRSTLAHCFVNVVRFGSDVSVFNARFHWAVCPVILVVMPLT